MVLSMRAVTPVQPDTVSSTQPFENDLGGAMRQLGPVRIGPIVLTGMAVNKCSRGNHYFGEMRIEGQAIFLIGKLEIPGNKPALVQVRMAPDADNRVPNAAIFRNTLWFGLPFQRELRLEIRLEIQVSRPDDEIQGSFFRLIKAVAAEETKYQAFHSDTGIHLDGQRDIWTNGNRERQSICYNRMEDR